MGQVTRAVSTAIRSKEDAQKSYEDFVEVMEMDNNKDLTDEKDYSAKITPDCD